MFLNNEKQLNFIAQTIRKRDKTKITSGALLANFEPFIEGWKFELLAKISSMGKAPPEIKLGLLKRVPILGVHKAPKSGMLVSTYIYS